jgi:O-antigen ligase
MQREGTPPATRLAAAIALVALAGVWAWWAAKDGAYFGAVMYPGLIVLCAAFVLVSSRTAWGARLTLTLPAKIALGALLGLALWSALSAFWSPVPDVAVADAQRIAGYALAFGLGIWLATLLGEERRQLAMVPLAFAGLFAGVIAVIGLLTGDDFATYVDAGTLQYPIGYRNANAAFFLIAVWPAVGLATSRELDWRLRALALGTATLCLELAALSQSRASMIAVAIALAVYLVVSRDRARAVGWLALAALPALLVIPDVTDLYQTRTIEDYAGTAEMEAAGRTALGGAAIAVVIGLIAAAVGRRIEPSERRASQANRAVAVGAVGLIVVGVIGFTAATGDPAGWVEDRVDEFLTQGTPHSERDTSRFSSGAGSERDDIWRVALDVAAEEPVVGTGGGGFQYEYLLLRSEAGIDSLRDAHSVEFEVLSELGIVGLVLFATAIVASLAGAWLSRGLSPVAASLAAIAITTGVYWLAHSSFDWFWTYAGVTAPVFALLGSACAGSALPRAAEPPGSRIWRPAAAVAAGLLAISVVAPFLAERYIESAYSGWRDDPDRAQDDLDRARDLNRLSIEPILAEGGIAQVAGRRDEAIAAFEEAAEERPEDWTAHYFLAELHRRSDPRRAQAELQTALELNPYGSELEELEERLAEDRAGPGG